MRKILKSHALAYIKNTIKNTTNLTINHCHMNERASRKCPNFVVGKNYVSSHSKTQIFEIFTDLNLIHGT